MADIELPKTPIALSPEALFNCQVVAFVLARIALGEVRAEVIGEAVETTHLSEIGEARTVSQRTLYRWLAAYEQGGPAGLEPASRQVAPTALSEQFLAFLRSEKTDDPRASIPEVIRRAREQQVLGRGESVDRVTVYRAALRLDLPLTQRSSKRDTDMRRFAYPHRMRMVLVDGKHFRAGQARLKRVAFFFIDDCSRRILGVVVGTSESTELLLRGLHLVILHFGLMDLLYFDRGPGFKSRDTHAVCVRLGIHFIHGKKRYPEGHGKIERFNKTAHNDVPLDGSLWAPHDGRLLRLHPVDLAHNAEAHRAAPRSVLPTPDPPEPPVTAAAMAFDHDFGPLPVPAGDAARRPRKP